MARPSIRQLEYFVAVAKHLHFGRAARAVAVTQPALSAQIRLLEELLGVRLFERDRRRVLLTSEGARLAVAARRALRAVDDVVELARPWDPLTGTLRLGVIPTLAPYVLPRVMPVVRERFPDLRLVLVEDQTDRVVAQLHRGDLDLLVLALPVDAVGAAVETQHLLDEPFLLACPAEHPLAGADGVRVADLAGTPMLLLEQGHCLRDHALDVCRLAGAPEDDDVRATSMTTLVQMVASGLGCTLLPALARDVETGSGSRLVVRAFEDPAPSRAIGLVWRKTSHHGAAYRTFGAAVADVLSDAVR